LQPRWPQLELEALIVGLLNFMHGVFIKLDGN